MAGRFEWFVAWRHLRDPDRGKQRTLKIGVALLLLAGLAYGTAVVLLRMSHPIGVSSFARMGRIRGLNFLQTGAILTAIAGGLIGYLGLLFRTFTVFTAFSIFGVFLGTAAPIIALSVMSGFEADLKNKIRGSKADVVVGIEGDETFSDWERVRRTVDAIPGVVGSTPFLESEVMLLAGRTPAGVYLRGIEPASAPRVIDLVNTMKQGTLADLDAPASKVADADADADAGDANLPAIILGEELYARILRVFTGDPIDVMCPLCGTGPTGAIPKLRRFRVTGHFYSGMYEFDSKIAYVRLAEAQRFLELPGEITGIDVRTRTPELAREVADAVRARLGPKYVVRSWEDLNRALFMALRLEKVAMFIVLTFIVLVASFSIVSNLFMLVTEKGREIAILKSMGSGDRAIFRVFLTEGFYIGLVGMAVGLATGIGACALIERFGLPLPADIYYIERLPVVMRATEIAGIALVAIGLSCLAALYPAAMASRLRPVEGLRVE